jgi:CHAT domain-containing protein
MNPRDPAVQAAVEAIREGARKGAYASTAAWADALPEPIRQAPEVALERARIRLRQGRISLAGDALAEARFEGAPLGVRALLALEQAAVLVAHDSNFDNAVAGADAVLARAAELDGVQWARVAAGHANIVFQAAAHFTVPPEAAAAAGASLSRAAEVLEREGCADDALAARHLLALRGQEGAPRLAALDAVAELAIAAGRAHLAAEARSGRAELLLMAHAPEEEILAELDAAETLYAGHDFGAIDVRRLRARLAADREGAGTAGLEECLRLYREADLPRRTMAVLRDLALITDRRGDVPSTVEWRRQAIALARDSGMGLELAGLEMPLAYLLMRSNDYTGAIELCVYALTRRLLPFQAAGYEAVLATAYEQTGNTDAALRHARNVLAVYEELGDEASASLAAGQMAATLSRLGTREALAEAEALLTERRVADEARGNLSRAVLHGQALVRLHFQRYSTPPPQTDPDPHLDAAEREILAAETLARRLPGVEGLRYTADLRQQRALLALMRNDAAGVERALLASLAAYEQGGMAMEAAGARHWLANHWLQLAGREGPLDPSWFEKAHDALRSTLDYYDGAGMRALAADTRQTLARLHANAEGRADGQPPGSMYAAALRYLAEAEADYDAMRVELSLTDTLEALHGKRALAERSRRVYELALRLSAQGLGDEEESWRWAQRGKARALGDTIGAGEAVPGRVLAALEEHPESLGRVQAERDAAARLAGASPEAEPALRAELDGARREVEADPRLAEYRELRMGAAVDADDLAEILPDGGVCVDWAFAGTELLLLARRPGSPARMVRIEVDAERLRGFVERELAPETYRATLHDMPEILHEMDFLVAPLAELTEPGERLILSPTGKLHALPLHALHVNGEPLLVRNPVVYTPSLAILRQCMARRGASAGRARTAAVFGDPGLDRARAGELAREAGRMLHTTPVMGGEVTRAAFRAALECDVVHFQGHAVHDPADALASHLVLADGKLTARDIFGLRRLRAELVALGACESAASVVATGDEPLGLIPALLYAGAGSVVATLWKVNATSAALVMRHFYEALEGGAVDRAEALRQAMLAVRATPEMETPYHWAPFVLHGAWC